MEIVGAQDNVVLTDLQAERQECITPRHFAVVGAVNKNWETHKHIPLYKI